MSHEYLTRNFVRTVRCPQGRAMIAYQDLHVPGLVLLVRDSELKVFSLRYRDKCGVKRHHLIGRYPNVRLGEAREQANELLDQICVETFPADW